MLKNVNDTSEAWLVAALWWTAWLGKNALPQPSNVISPKITE